MATDDDDAFAANRPRDMPCVGRIYAQNDGVTGFLFVAVYMCDR